MAHKSNKIISVVGSFLQMLILLVLVVVAVMTFGSRIPLLAKLGLNFFAVTSGSMEPNLPTGSLIYVGRYKLEELKEGDIITFRKNDPDMKQSAVVTHRIASVTRDEEMQKQLDQAEDKKVITYTIKTKGDANTTEDNFTVKPDEIIGLYKWHVAKLGYVSIFAQSPPGFVLLVIVPAVILVIWEVVSLILHFKNHYQQKSQAEIHALKAELAKHEESKHE